MDYVSTLQDEAEELESVQAEIRKEIVYLREQKARLGFILRTHEPRCTKGIAIVLKGQEDRLKVEAKEEVKLDVESVEN